MYTTHLELNCYASNTETAQFATLFNSTLFSLSKIIYCRIHKRTHCTLVVLFSRQKALTEQYQKSTGNISGRSHFVFKATQRIHLLMDVYFRKKGNLI